MFVLLVRSSWAFFCFVLFLPQSELLTKTNIFNATSGLLTGNSKFYLTDWSES